MLRAPPPPCPAPGTLGPFQRRSLPHSPAGLSPLGQGQGGLRGQAVTPPRSGGSRRAAKREGKRNLVPAHRPGTDRPLEGKSELIFITKKKNKNQRRHIAVPGAPQLSCERRYRNRGQVTGASPCPLRPGPPPPPHRSIPGPPLRIPAPPLRSAPAGTSGPGSGLSCAPRAPPLAVGTLRCSGISFVRSPAGRGPPRLPVTGP